MGGGGLRVRAHPWGGTGVREHPRDGVGSMVSAHSRGRVGPRFRAYPRDPWGGGGTRHREHPRGPMGRGAASVQGAPRWRVGGQRLEADSCDGRNRGQLRSGGADPDQANVRCDPKQQQHNNKTGGGEGPGALARNVPPPPCSAAERGCEFALATSVKKAPERVLASFPFRSCWGAVGRRDLAWVLDV